MGCPSIDNKMSITEAQAIADFRRLSNLITDAAKRQAVADCKQKLDPSCIMSALGRRVRLEEAAAFSNKYTPLAAVSSQTARCVAQADGLLKEVEREKQKLRSYRSANPDFRELLNSYVSGEEGKNLKIWQALSDWKELKRSVAGLQLCDDELLREFAVLDGLFQILHYHFVRCTERTQAAVRSKLKAVLEGRAFEPLLRADRLACAALEKLLEQSILVHGKPKELSNQDEIDTNHSSNKKMLFKSSLSKKTGKPVRQRVSFGSDNRSKLSLSQPTDTQDLTGRRYYDSNAASLPLASKQGQLCVIDLEESEPKTTLKSHASSCDEARATIKNRLYEVVLPVFNIRVARCYAQRIEADIFSLFHADLKLYKTKGRSCAEVLRSLLTKQVSLDSLMTTCFDYSQLKRLSESLVEGELESLPLGDTALGKRSAVCSEYRRGPLSVSDMQPCKIGGDALSPFDSEETDSAELLAEVARLREREISQYMQLLQHELKEHERLTREHAMVQEQLASCVARK